MENKIKMENIVMLKDQLIKEIGRMINSMEKENIVMPMDQFI